MKSKILLLSTLTFLIALSLVGCVSAPANSDSSNEVMGTATAEKNNTGINTSSTNNNYGFNDSTDIEHLLSVRTAGIKLKIIDSVNDIDSVEDIFPVRINSNVIVSEEEGVKEWAIEKTLFSNGYFIIRRDRNGQVFITKASDREEIKFDFYEITPYLREAGIDISSMTVDKLDMDYCYSNSYLNFRISDGTNSAFFSSRWNKFIPYSSRWDETKHIKTIPLLKYNIIDTAFRYNADDTDETGSYTTEAYIMKNNNHYSLILWCEKLKKSYRYDIPGEIGEIVELYDENQLELSGYAGATRKLYLKAVDPQDSTTYIYQIDLQKNEMRKYSRTADWKREYDLEWRFTGDLKYNYILGAIEGLLVVYGDDGGISGFHDHKYLYGIDMNTGRKVWSVYGGYTQMNWSLSEDKKNIFIAVKVNDSYEPRVLNIDIHSGAVIWEKVFKSCYGIRVAAVSEDAAVELIEQGKGYDEVKMVKTYDGGTGNLVWERKLGKDEHLVATEGSMPGMITYYKDGIRVYDSKTGKLKLSLNGRLRKSLAAAVSPFYWVIENPAKPYEKPATGEIWLAFEDGFKLVDLASGSLLHSIESSPDSYMHFLDDENVLIENAAKGSFPREYSKGFSLYSLKDHKKLWSREDALSIAAADNGRLFFLSESEIYCVDLYTGKTNWEKKFPSLGAAIPVVIGNELIISNGELFSFDVSNGEFNYQETSCVISGPLYWKGIFNWPTIYKSGNKVLISNCNGDLELLKPEQSPG